LRSAQGGDLSTRREETGELNPRNEEPFYF